LRNFPGKRRMIFLISGLRVNRLTGTKGMTPHKK
jgi:hypothetical protein